LLNFIFFNSAIKALVNFLIGPPGTVLAVIPAKAPANVPVPRAGADVVMALAISLVTVTWTVVESLLTVALIEFTSLLLSLAQSRTLNYI
jgi:hypothetical protein